MGFEGTCNFSGFFFLVSTDSQGMLSAPRGVEIVIETQTAKDPW